MLSGWSKETGTMAIFSMDSMVDVDLVVRSDVVVTDVARFLSHIVLRPMHGNGMLP